MALYNEPFEIGFEGTKLSVIPRLIAGRRVFNITFGDARPPMAIFRKQEGTDAYWISVSDTDSRDVESIGSSIGTYFDDLNNRPSTGEDDLTADPKFIS